MLYVPDVNKNLLSIRQFDKEGKVVIVANNKMKILDPISANDKMKILDPIRNAIITGNAVNNLYRFGIATNFLHNVTTEINQDKQKQCEHE